MTSLEEMRSALKALRLEVPSSVAIAVELKVWSHVEHVTSSRDKLFESFSQMNRERDAALRDLDRLCGPICPHDRKRAIEHEDSVWSCCVYVHTDTTGKQFDCGFGPDHYYHEEHGERWDHAYTPNHPPAPEIEAWLRAKSQVAT